MSSLPLLASVLLTGSWMHVALLLELPVEQLGKTLRRQRYNRLLKNPVMLSTR